MSATRQGGKREADLINRNDAAVIFTSAIFYVQQSGIGVSYGEDNGKLVLTFDGLQALTGDDGLIRFVPKNDYHQTESTTTNPLPPKIATTIQT